MEQFLDRPGSATSDGDASPVVPLWQQLTMLLLRVECLAGAAAVSLKSSDSANAARMTAELRDVIQQAKEIAERMHAL